MSKVLVGANWFDELASTSFYENDYEGLIIQNRQSIFPDFHVLNFKKTVYSDEGAAQADLAIIDKKYRDWWVVEVELSHHSLQKHVLPQVRVLSAAYYRESEAMYLWRQMIALDLCRLRDLVRVRQPGVIVVVDSVKADWLQELKRFDILILMLQVFRSSFNEYIFRWNGDYPSMPHDIVS
ncbi:MAG: hypothetical protein IH859_07205, partial [Chloroflexi bacterium]|nr:hypothetical protein [Chloroflexota bacterium]